MTQTFYIIRGFGQAYGAGTYGSCSYSDTTSCGTTSTGSSSGSGGVLTNTGIMVSAIVGLACLAIFIALVVRFWRRPAKDGSTQQAETAASDADDSQQDDTTHNSIDE